MQSILSSDFHKRISYTMQCSSITVQEKTNMRAHGGYTAISDISSMLSRWLHRSADLCATFYRKSREVNDRSGMIRLWCTYSILMCGDVVHAEHERDSERKVRKASTRVCRFA